MRFELNWVNPDQKDTLSIRFKGSVFAADYCLKKRAFIRTQQCMRMKDLKRLIKFVKHIEDTGKVKVRRTPYIPKINK